MKKISRVLMVGLLLLCACGESKKSTGHDASQWVDTYKSLDEALADPDKVQILRLDKFDETQLPPEMVKLKNLRILMILKAPKLKSTMGIGGLKRLESFYLNESVLEEIAPDIAELKHLKEFSLGTSKLTNFPVQLWSLSSLENLSIGGPNYLITLPKEVGGLKALTELTIGSRIRPDSGPVQGDGIITIRRDQIVETPFPIPSEIGELSRLRFLTLNPTNLSPLPREIFNLTSLEQLSLGSDGLKSIPPEIGNLKNLKVLVLSQNELTKLPEEISQLKNLKTLRLDGNPLSDAEKTRIRDLVKHAEVEF